VARLSLGTIVQPDLALVEVATGQLWLATEVISSDDHRTDTGAKKVAYEAKNLPRLWMVDPRYNNVEVYHTSQYGLILKNILAGAERLTEPQLPTPRVTMSELS